MGRLYEAFVLGVALVLGAACVIWLLGLV